MAATFVPGLQLAREFYAAEVRPLLEGQFAQVSYAASLIGPGSEVVGFDTERSTDHDWGPRLQVFLSDRDADHFAAAITAMLAGQLPESFRGFPVAFPVTREPGGTARHRVEVTGLGTWLSGRLGFDPRQTVTLLDRRYPPYGKWLGTAFARLPGTGGLAASLTAAISSGSWPARELLLRDAYETVAAPRPTRSDSVEAPLMSAMRLSVSVPTGLSTAAITVITTAPWRSPAISRARDACGRDAGGCSVSSLECRTVSIPCSRDLVGRGGRGGGAMKVVQAYRFALNPAARRTRARPGPPPTRRLRHEHATEHSTATAE